MAHCWEEYISKVHNAEPLDPWVTNVELLDIFIEKGRSWLPWKSPKRTRIGSMINLGDKEAKDWKENVENLITTGLQRLEAGGTNAREVSNINMFREDQGMADMQASIKVTTSLLGSIFTGKSVETQFDVKGHNSANCVVTGVKSRRVRLDTLMDLVNERGVNEPARWRPNISRPEFQWSSKRGQTLWVVTEILYASKIKLETDKETGAGTTTKILPEAKLGEVKASAELTEEKDGTWVVTAAQQKSFPFAFRTLTLKYDTDGNLRQSGTNRMRKSKSLTRIANKSATAEQRAEQLHRNASVSQLTS